MELSLTNREWNEFIIDDIFKVYSTSSGIDKNKLINLEGNIPYITRTDKNNGCDMFIGIQDLKYKTDKSNVITIGLDTQTIFYQEVRFYTGQNIQILEFNEINKYNANFLIPLLKKQMSKFNWGGNGATLTRLKKTKILLPVNSKGDPDYTFMEEYMRNKERDKINNFKKYATKIISNLKSSKELESLNQKEWGEFEIGGLFKIFQGKSKGLNHLNKCNSGINYLGATNLNNGVLAFVEIKGNEKMVQQGNCIAFIRNGEGSMGFSIYKAESFIATSDISVGYSKYLNREVGLFITTIADKVRGKYNFGYKRSDKRLKKEKLNLPVNTKGQPDYEYMEKYMKELEYKKLEQYLNYKNIKTYK